MKTRLIAAFALGGALALPFHLGAAAPSTPPPAPTATRAPAPAPAKASAAAPVELTLSPYAGLLRTVQGKIGDLEGPFLFDTGGGATFLSVESVKKLGLNPFGRVTGFRHDGGRIDAQRAGPVELQLGAYRRYGEAGVLDLGPLLGNLPPVAGIVSLETFEGQAITVDLARNRLIVETPKSLAQRIRGARELRVRYERQAGGATLDLNVAIEGKHGPLWFELDSGSLATVLAAPHAFAELGIEPPAEGQTRKAELSILGLGPVPCEIASKEMIYDGILNAEFFTRYVITLDLARSRAWVVPTR